MRFESFGQQLRPGDEIGFSIATIVLYFPELFFMLVFNVNIGVVASSLTTDDVNDLAWLFNEPPDLCITVEQSKCLQLGNRLPLHHSPHQIGRASCRERV